MWHQVTLNESWYDDVIKWKHFPRNCPFVRGIHRSPVNSPHKGQWRESLMFSLICGWINDWVNTREAGDLRCYRAHYDVIVMESRCVMICHCNHGLSNSVMKDLPAYICESILNYSGQTNARYGYCTVEFTKHGRHISWRYHDITPHSAVLYLCKGESRNIFRVIGPLYGEFTGHRWIPLTKASDAELKCFIWPAPE